VTLRGVWTNQGIKLAISSRLERRLDSRRIDDVEVRTRAGLAIAIASVQRATTSNRKQEIPTPATAPRHAHSGRRTGSQNIVLNKCCVLRFIIYNSGKSLAPGAWRPQLPAPRTARTTRTAHTPHAPRAPRCTLAHCDTHVAGVGRWADTPKNPAIQRPTDENPVPRSNGKG
jgi:hypothetical protein